MLDISVLVVNYNTADVVSYCIESVLKQCLIKTELIVVDNDSDDNSVRVLQSFGSRLTVIANNDNKGFGRANNQAFKQSQGRYLFLLNPDAVLLTDLDLFNAVNYMEAHPQYGLVGTAIVDKVGNIVKSASLHYPKEHQTTVDFSYLPGKWATVLGASMIVRRDVFEKIVGFDEDFFLYAEETDLCLRIRQVGYLIGYYDAIKVKHIGGASERNYPKEEVIRKKKAGKYLFYRKHYPLADVIKFIQHERTHARFHLVRLFFKKWIMGFNQYDQIRYTRLRVSYDMATRFLHDYRPSRFHFKR